MQIIYTVHKLLFFETTDLYSLDTAFKEYFKLVKVNINFSEYICIQWKYQHRIRCEIRILLEIILNFFECWQYLLPLKYFGNSTTFVYWQLASFVNLPCCQICTFSCPLRKKRRILLTQWTDTYIWQHIHRKDWTLNVASNRYA